MQLATTLAERVVFFFCGKTTAVARPHRGLAKSRLSNPAHINTMPTKKHDTSCRAFPLAERVGFEPTCGFTRNSISSRARYDHFDTAPYSIAEQNDYKRKDFALQ